VWRLAGVVVVGAFLSMLDGSIVAVGLDAVGPDVAFEAAFLVLAGVGVLALAAATWLARVA
jgi:fucose permease